MELIYFVDVELRQLEHGLRPRGLGLALGDALEDHFERDQRAFGVERLEFVGGHDQSAAGPPQGGRGPLGG